MWKVLASIAIGAWIASSIRAAEPPAAVQEQPAKWFAAKPGDNPYADPFFAAPGESNGIDPVKPGSGPAPCDTMLPRCTPFRAERIWFAADFYHAVSQGTLVPPLVTTAPNGTVLGTAGALGQPTTSLLYGGRRELGDSRPGLRATAGLWLTEDSRFGVDGTVLYVGNASSSFARATDANGAILAQPVTFGLTGTPLAVPVGFLGAGSISAHASRAIIGGDANFRYGLSTSERGRLDLLVGYRYLRLSDSIDVASLHTVTGFPQLDTALSDSFSTLNQFHGGQIGLGGTHRLFDRLTLTTKGTVAIGVNISDVTISGQTYTVAGASNGGLLTGSNNIGTFRDNYFAVVPEGTLKLGWDFTDRFRINAGYSFLYWTKVRRAADQIDTTIQAGSRPAFRNYDTDYWVQGWTVGLDLRW